MIKNVLFDLDGTLLPMDQDEFVKAYFNSLSLKLAPFGYEPKKLVSAVWSGTGAMVNNDGNEPNERVFWRKFASIMGEQSLDDMSKFEEYYKVEFDSVKEVCGFSPKAKFIIDWLKERKVRLVLATNPIFPKIATEKRIKWAGLDPSDFELYTTYENIGFSKPNLNYYLDILGKLNMDPRQTLMVGNDVNEDMVAKNANVHVFLLTNCLINKNKVDISCYPHGSFDELYEFLKTNIR